MKGKEVILILDDKEKDARNLANLLKLRNYEAVWCTSAGAARKLIESEDADLVVLDLCLNKDPKPDPATGRKFLRELQDKWPHIPVIIMSAFGTIDTAVACMREGASDFIAKPVVSCDVLDTVIKRSLKSLRDRSELYYHRNRENACITRDFTTESDNSIFHEIVDNFVPKVACKPITVLILGETGTGKTKLAKFIHKAGNRNDKPFIQVDLAAIASSLVEPELFGNVKGAFTGANKDRCGLVEMADGGTLFLDEIGELPLHAQGKLLRLIDERVIRKVGADRNRQVDVRIIAASNRDLHGMSPDSFREDLLARLEVAKVTLPPLRERLEDLTILIQHWVTEYSRKHRCKLIRFSDDAMQSMRSYEWPSNVRELKNLIENYIVFHEGETIGVELLPPRFPRVPRSSETVSVLDRKVYDTEFELVNRTLKECDGNKGKTAEKLGKSRHSLKRTIQRLEKAGYRFNLDRDNQSR